MSLLRKGNAMKIIGPLAMLVFLTGCNSPWRQTFEPATDLALEPTERVVIRRVPWDRLNEALHSIEAERADSDVHPDEWPDDRLTDEHTRLVTALQLSEDPAEVTVIGRSVFRATFDVSILDGELSSFARSIGADYAIWSTTYLGKTETVEQEPIVRHGYTRGRYRRRDGYVDYDYLPYHETLYVPVVVERDEHAWMVYYVRITE